MTIAPDEFDRKLRDYALSRFIPALNNPLTRFALGAAAGAGTLGLAMLGGVDAIRPLGAVTTDGKVDLDTLKRAVYAGFDATADGKVPVHKWGLALSVDKGDAEALFASMEAPPAEPAKAA